MHTHELPHVGVVIQGGTLVFNTRTASRRRQSSTREARDSVKRTSHINRSTPAPRQFA